MTVFSVFFTVAACKHCHSAKQPHIVDPEGPAHPNQRSKVSLELAKVHIILTADNN